MTEIIGAALPSFHQLTLDLTSERAIDSPLELWKRYGRLSRVNRQNSRKLGWLAAIAGYKGAEKYRDDPSQLPELQAYMRSEGRIYEPTIEQVLLYGICISLDAGFKGQSYKNACACANLLQPLFDHRVPANTVLDAIVAARGLRGLDVKQLLTTKPKVRLLMPGERKNAGPAMGNKTSGAVHLHTPSPSGDDIEEALPASERRRVSPVRHPARPTQKALSREKKLHCRLGLENQADADQLKKMQVGDCAYLVIECREMKGGRKYIEVASIHDA